MDKKYLISQAFAFLSFCFAIIAYQRKTKKKILKTMIVSNTFNLIHYTFLGAYSGCLTKILGFLRDYIIISKGKKKSTLMLWILVALYIIATIMTYKSIYSILPLIAAIVYLFGIYNGDELKIKKTAFVCYFFWLAYNICVFSVVAIISNIISIVAAFIAIKRYKKGRLS